MAKTARRPSRTKGKPAPAVRRDPRRAATAKPAPSAPAPLTVVILAAGAGKRMKSDLPKVLQPLAGRPLLKHVLDTARRLEPDAVHVVYGYGGDLVRTALQGESVSWDLQEQQLGTGHAVAQSMPAISDDHLVLILYGDVPLIRLETLVQLLGLAGPKQVALLTLLPDDPTGYGRIIRDSHNRVRKIVEQQDATRRELEVRESNSGILAAPAKLLRNWLKRLRNNNSQGEYYLTDVISLAVADGVTVNPLVASSIAEVQGVNDKVQLAQLESAYRWQIAHELMLAGVTIADPTRIDVRGRITHGADVFLDVNVVLEGNVKLGDRVRIGPGCVVRNSEIGDDTELFGHCFVDSAVIGSSCNIGPFARFRPSSTLASGVHIGNFVEVKNSQMGAGSKANHLTYIGDARVGERVNLGAGTIIANYDGANKHRTNIEDDVHTGSNSVLVAPITVGAGSTIAAGSTVVKDVPPGGLTIARQPQVTKPDWLRPKKK